MSCRPVRPDPVGHALRRGKHKSQIFLELRERGPLTAAQLARSLGVRFHRVVGDVHGRFPDQLPAKSLVSVGLVVPVRRAWGVAYALTPSGVLVAERLQAGDRF